MDGSAFPVNTPGGFIDQKLGEIFASGALGEHAVVCADAPLFRDPSEPPDKIIRGAVNQYNESGGPQGTLAFPTTHDGVNVIVTVHALDMSRADKALFRVRPQQVAAVARRVVKAKIDWVLQHQPGVAPFVDDARPPYELGVASRVVAGSGEKYVGSTLASLAAESAKIIKMGEPGLVG